MAPDEQRQTRLAVAILVVAALAFWSLRIIGRPGVATAAVSPDTPSQVELDSLSRYLTPMADSLAASRDTVNAAAFEGDPFEPPAPVHVAPAPRSAVAPAPAPDWVLSAIFITASRRAAVVNDVLVNIGDRLPGGARVSAIERDHVVIIEPSGTQRRLTLREGTTE